MYILPIEDVYIFLEGEFIYIYKFLEDFLLLV